MPKVNPHADPTRRDLGPAALGRTVKKLFSYYPVLAPVTFVCILFSSIVSSVPSLFTQNIIQIIEKWYISRDWAAARAEIVPYLTLLVVLYALSILSMTVYTQLMAYMTQGFLHKLRCEMFGGMQKLPIRYFDSHQHGDIMSHYTNDIDTLRQLVSQALPALIQSGAIVLVVFSIMLYFSLWLTLVLVLGIIAMVAVTKKIGGGSAKYFVRQQKAVASTEGFIQEMMAGQKVVKVFCHEQKSIEDFDRLNDALFEDSFRAQAYASVLGPIIGNIGNILYVTLALVGGVFLLIGLPNVSLSGKALDISILVPFLNMARQFTGNVNQLSQQINAVVMAGAGAQRVFALIDEKPETNDGYVTLVNAAVAPDGTVTESDRRTGHWAWKHPHGDGTLTYTELRGDVRLTDVDFAYTEGKDVLHDVSVYAEPGQKVAFVGATGAGKTTILNMLGGMDTCDEGSIWLDGNEVSRYNQKQLTEYRRYDVGFVFQSYHLLSTLTALENVTLPLIFKGVSVKERNEQAMEMLEAVGLADRANHKPFEMSGGQQQRVSIARAFVNRPPVVFADEPTGNLDTKTTYEMMDLITGMAQKNHQTLVIVTHDQELAEYADRIVVLQDGKIEKIQKRIREKKENVYE